MFPVQVSDKVHRGWTDGQFFDFTPMKILQITSQRLTWNYEKMVADHFDCLPIEVLFTEQSYPRETSFFPSGARNMQIGYLYANFTRLCGAATSLPPLTTDLMMISSLTIIKSISMIGYRKNP